MANTTTSKDVDAYFKKLEADKKEPLEKIRLVIKTSVPEAEECISYGMPAFKYNGMLVGYAAFKNHMSFFPMNPEVIKMFKEDLKDFSIAKGTIQFSSEKMLPDDLIRKIVKERVEENLIKSKLKKQKK